MARADVEPAAEGNSPRLLHADEERLRLVAATLARSSRFVLVVATADLWSTAAQFLSGLLPDHRFVERIPFSSEATVLAIDDPLRYGRQTTIVIHVTGEEAGPIEALNLRRESLTGGDANFLVVLQGDAVHRRFLQEAPDCYSYRDVLAVLEGEPLFDRPAQADFDVEEFLKDARQVGDPFERARELLFFVKLLISNNQQDRTPPLLDEALSALADPEHSLQDLERALLADLYYLSAGRASHVDAYHKIRKALEVLAPVANVYPQQVARLEGHTLDGLGFELRAALEAVRRARVGNRGALPWQLLTLASSYIGLGNLHKAREVLTEIDVRALVMVNNLARWIWYEFHLLIGEGAWNSAAQLVVPATRVELHTAHDRAALDYLWAQVLRTRGEGRVARRIYESLSSNAWTQTSLAILAANNFSMSDAKCLLEGGLERAWKAQPNVDELNAVHRMLLYIIELDSASGGSTFKREDLDSRLAVLLRYIGDHEPDPPWALIRCLLCHADAYLQRHGGERFALERAEEAWELAEANATVMAAMIARRLMVAALRLGEFDRARGWLERGLAHAREHEDRGSEAHLRSLALWLAALAGGDVQQAEVEMRAAIAATGSVLIEASALARVGRALGRHDLLRRAQQIYRSLPWPEREGACLEALGETRIAEVRYRTFELVARLKILERGAAPPPITAVDDPDPWS